MKLFLVQTNHDEKYLHSIGFPTQEYDDVTTTLHAIDLISFMGTHISYVGIHISLLSDTTSVSEVQLLLLSDGRVAHQTISISIQSSVQRMVLRAIMQVK